MGAVSAVLSQRLSLCMDSVTEPVHDLWQAIALPRSSFLICKFGKMGLGPDRGQAEASLPSTVLTS